MIEKYLNVFVIKDHAIMKLWPLNLLGPWHSWGRRKDPRHV
jgi:hypothetical protein